MANMKYHLTLAQRCICWNFIPYHDCLLQVLLTCIEFFKQVGHWAGLKFIKKMSHEVQNQMKCVHDQRMRRKGFVYTCTYTCKVTWIINEFPILYHQVSNIWRAFRVFCIEAIFPASGFVLTLQSGRYVQPWPWHPYFLQSFLTSTLSFKIYCYPIPGALQSSVILYLVPHFHPVNYRIVWHTNDSTLVPSPGPYNLLSFFT